MPRIFILLRIEEGLLIQGELLSSNKISSYDLLIPTSIGSPFECNKLPI